MTESYIRENKDKVNWIYISSKLNLSEEFIEEFKDYVDWFLISFRQKLSEEFIKNLQIELIGTL